HRIYLDHFHGKHFSGVADHFHGEMSFAVRCAAAHGSADAGRKLRIDEIEIEREVEAGRAVAGDCDGVPHDVAEAALVDIAHREGAYAGGGDLIALELIDVANSDQRYVCGIDLRRE